MSIKLLIGLGNPGRKYKKTRHNIGFLVVETLAGESGFELKKKKFRSRFLLERFFGKEICLVKPETFMNLSGESVGSFVNYFKVEMPDLLVVHDDIDLPLGKLRFAFKSGHGGHNGIRSITDRLETNEFYRLKIGVGRPTGEIDPADHVLGKFNKDEEMDLKKIIENAVAAIKTFYTEGPKVAMQQCN